MPDMSRTLLLAALFVSLLPAKTIRTVAGTGAAGYSGDGGPSAQAQINNPYGLVVGPDGALYVCEIGNHVIRRIDLKKGLISTVAGNGKQGFSGDGGPATQASLNEPYEIRFDKQGNMFFVEMKNHLIRRVDARTKIISTVAGRPEPGFSGDGGPAAKAQFRQPHSIAFDPQGRLLICDIGNHRVRRIDMKSGAIDTYIGNGERKPTPDGAPLKGTPVNGPRAIDLDKKGNLYLVLREGNMVFRIDPKKETIHHIAGTGNKGLTGDGADARKADLNGPKGVAWAPDNSIYIADTESHTIRRIDLNTGIISTPVGDGQRGDGPETDPRKCRTARPHGVFADSKGVVYIGDSEAHRVRILQ
ncbi:MAG: SMP-30/gluconolactonase/LRE family protein [Bryobacterales bacterium]|nr:SMP-30/gluconolactonase/LRE family protein [Bryobacterales bacterium]